MGKNEIVFYCMNSADFPWSENARTLTRQTFNSAVLSSLICFDSNNEMRPVCLETFTWNKKNNEYILTLKQGCRFTNGRKITIEDLEFSILRTLFRNVKTDCISAFFNIIGANKIIPGQKYESGIVEGVKILNKNSLSVSLCGAYPDLIHVLTKSNNSLVPMEELKEDLINWKKWPVGIGPYEVTNEDKDFRIYTLELLDPKKYPNAPLKIHFQQERILKPDISIKDALALDDLYYEQSTLKDTLGIKILSFNYSSDLGKNPAFRKAIDLSLKRKEISETTLFKTSPLNEVLTRGSKGRIGNIESYNLEKAQKLFRKVLGSKIDQTFIVPCALDFDYLGNTYKEVICKQLKEAGLNVDFQISNSKLNPFQKEFQNSPFVLHSKIADYYEPLINFIEIKNENIEVNNYPKFSKINDLINEVKKSSSNENMIFNLEKLSSYFIENNIVVPLFEIPSVAFYNSKKIKSIGQQIGGQAFYLQNLVMKKD